MLFNKSSTYTHKRMLDAAIFILKCFRVPSDGRYKLKIRWMNRRGMDLGIVENVVVKKEEIKNWYEI